MRKENRNIYVGGVRRNTCDLHDLSGGAGDFTDGDDCTCGADVESR